MASVMEAPAVLENGAAPQDKRSTCSRVAFHALIFVSIIISALVAITFCLLHHQQAPRPCWAHGSLKEQIQEDMIWDWKLQHCNGIVQDEGQYLTIQKSGSYFIYAQLYRKERATRLHTVMLYRYPEEPLTNAVGHENGTVNFARPFLLQEGDKLYCRKNDNRNDILLESNTYWGLFKM